MPEPQRRDPVRLPHELTNFVGRKEAVTAVKHALSGSRLVTLTGPGGVGKSRLGLRVAKDLRRALPDGVWLVDMADVHDTASVAQAVSVALGLGSHAARSPATALADYLAERRALLVLDNCEHVLTGCCRLVSTLLAAAPDLRVLVASREPLGASGEQIWPVPPLSTPTVDELELVGSPGGHEALALFGDRAAAVIPDFTVDRHNQTAVARLCQRLDGIPLAIELAAMHLRAFSIEQILDQLEDRFRLLAVSTHEVRTRQRTLRATIDRSFELCSATERMLWARCSVFAGEFDLDAVENVCSGHGITEADVFAGVTGLLDKSILIRADDGHTARYLMLETERQYGRDQLTSGEDASLRRRHRDYYLHLAEQSDTESIGARQAELTQRLPAERANFLAALDYCLTEPDEARTGLRMATALWFLWVACGFLEDGRYWLDRALALDTGPSNERVRALWVDGWAAFLQGDVTAGLALHHEGRDLARRLSSEAAFVQEIPFFDDEELSAGGLRRVLSLLNQALTRRDEPGYWAAPALLTFALGGQNLGLPGDVDGVLELSRECRALCASAGERWALSWAGWNVSVTWWAMGNPEKAQEDGLRALRRKSELRDRIGIACCVELLSWVAGYLGEPRRAAVLAGAAAKTWQPMTQPLFGSEVLLRWSRESQARVREALGERVFEAAYQKGTRLSQDEVVSYALAERSSVPATGPRRKTGQPKPLLTRREQEVAELVAAGMTNRAIAAQLIISQRTAETHVESILTKLGLTSRTQVATWCLGKAS